MRKTDYIVIATILIWITLNSIMIAYYTTHNNSKIEEMSRDISSIRSYVDRLDSEGITITVE